MSDKSIDMGDQELVGENGEKLSKNELKRRLKEQKKAAEKAEKEKAKAIANTKNVFDEDADEAGSCFMLHSGDNVFVKIVLSI